MAPQGKILVTGATGKVGRNVAELLDAAGADVRALARDPASAGLPAGVEVVPGHLGDPAGIEAALDSVDAVFLLWPGYVIGVDAAAETVDLIAKHARRVVFLSANGVHDGADGADGAGTREDFHATFERLIKRSWLTWTFLRPGGFAGNALGWAAGIRAEGVVREPYGLAGRALVHERDLAEVAVAALTQDGHEGRTYQLSGPRVLTQIEQVHEIGRAIGRQLRFEELSHEEGLRRWLDAGVPPELAHAAIDGLARFVDEPEPVTSTVESITGTPARTFATWAADHAEDFR